MTERTNDGGAVKYADCSPGEWVFNRGGGHAPNRIESSESVHKHGRHRESPCGRSTASYSDVVCENLGDPDLPGPAANIALICDAKKVLAQRDALVDALEKAIIHIAAIGMPLNSSGEYDKNGEWSFDEALPNKADGVEIKAAFDLIESSLAGVKEQQ